MHDQLQVKILIKSENSLAKQLLWKILWPLKQVGYSFLQNEKISAPLVERDKETDPLWLTLNLELHSK